MTTAAQEWQCSSIENILLVIVGRKCFLKWLAFSTTINAR
jgi:hypothetical protein